MKRELKGEEHRENYELRLKEIFLEVGFIILVFSWRTPLSLKTWSDIGVRSSQHLQYSPKTPPNK